MTTTTLPLVAFLSTQPEYTGSLYAFGKASEISPAEATKQAMDAAGAGEVVANVEQRGTKSILTASLSKRAVRRIARAQKEARSTEVSAAISAALEANRPLKIGAIVEATGCARSEVLDALRAGRDAESPSFYSFNTTGSNFHMSWSNEPSGVVFPEPAPEPEVEASAEVTEADVSVSESSDVEASASEE